MLIQRVTDIVSQMLIRSTKQTGGRTGVGTPNLLTGLAVMRSLGRGGLIDRVSLLGAGDRLCASHACGSAQRLNDFRGSVKRALVGGSSVNAGDADEAALETARHPQGPALRTPPGPLRRTGLRT